MRSAWARNSFFAAWAVRSPVGLVVMPAWDTSRVSTLVKNNTQWRLKNAVSTVKKSHAETGELDEESASSGLAHAVRAGGRCSSSTTGAMASGTPSSSRLANSSATTSCSVS